MCLQTGEMYNYTIQLYKYAKQTTHMGATFLSDENMREFKLVDKSLSVSRYENVFHLELRVTPSLG